MKIVKEDKDLMILEEKNIIVFVGGIIFLLLGLLLIFKPDFSVDKIPMWFSFIMVLSGVFAVFVAKFVTISLDKKSNKLLLLRRGLAGKIIKEYRLDRVKKVEVLVTYVPASGEGIGGYSYNLSFVLDDGEIVPLNLGGSSITRICGKQVIPEETLGKKIADFLDVPFKETQSPMVKSLKDMEKRHK